MNLYKQQHIQWDFDTIEAALAPKLWHPKKIKNKKIKFYLNLKCLGSALSALSSNVEVLNSNIFGLSVPISQVYFRGLILDTGRVKVDKIYMWHKILHE